VTRRLFPPRNSDAKQNPLFGFTGYDSVPIQHAGFNSIKESNTSIGLHLGTGSPKVLYNAVPMLSLNRRLGPCRLLMNFTT
jgi:hypothetical protein